jgi:succinyl-CoA synthetase alpha subunit
MAIFLTENSKVIVQGMTGSEGSRHTQRMLNSGTDIVGGVTPKKGGQTVDFEGASVPVFNTVQESVDATGADVSVVFVPPRFTKGAVVESVDAGIPLIIVITEGVPVRDTAEFFAYAQSRGGSRIVGSVPGSPTPASSRPTSPRVGASAWCRSRAR